MAEPFTPQTKLVLWLALVARDGKLIHVGSLATAERCVAGRQVD